jgi:hypothetical protein
MYRPRTNIPRKKKTNKRPVPAGVLAAAAAGRTKAGPRSPDRPPTGKKVDFRKTADELRAGFKPAMRRIKQRKVRLENEGPGHMGMGFAGGGKIKTKGYAKGGAMKTKGYAKGGAMKTKGGAKGGKKFKPPRSKNTGLYGR